LFITATALSLVQCYFPDVGNEKSAKNIMYIARSK